ncbi:MAG: hypothetical protein WAQ25_03710 [Candidatus Saccharimonas sp.]
MRNKLIVAALVLIGLASVAYAAFAQVLTINGTSTASGTWDVKITGITRASASGATDAALTPSFTATTATFDSTLAYPGATATYNVTVTNAGTVPAKLTSIGGLAAVNAAAPTYVGYTISGVTAGTTTLAANGGTNTITVTITWDSASTVSTTGASKTGVLTFNYDQDTP